MQIAPRYDGEPPIQLEVAPGAVAVPLLRQRRRLAARLASFTPGQWAAPSRCEGWRAQDVVSHLTTTDQFWQVAIESGLAGTPTQILATFDPVTVPDALVAAERDATPDAALAAYVDSSAGLCATIESLEPQAWSTIAECPAGHCAVEAVAHHALWDSWVHERDILQPLGLTQDLEDDEVLACLRYAAALSPAFAVQSDAERAGALVLDVTEPDARVVVEVDDGVVRVRPGGSAPTGAAPVAGGAVELLEALSVRAPWTAPLPPDQAWLVRGLAEVFRG